MARKTKAAKAAVGTLRVAGYSRTSGEGQRDNTSIPRQKEAIEAFCKLNDWNFVFHYVDESKTGSKEEGRDEFQQMIRDAANDKFDMIVVFDIKRFSRDGVDIITNAKVLRDTLNVHVVDTKNQFDTRDRRNTLVNYVHAGVSEQERLDIMDRMIGGRIRKAQEGKPWCGHRPMGRDYQVWVEGHGWMPLAEAEHKIGKKAARTLKGKWYVTEHGQKLREMLTRYADGEQLNGLVEQYGFSSNHVVLFAVRNSQLSGTYVFRPKNLPEIDMVNLEIPIPSIPEVISSDLEKRVRDRMEHNRTWNKEKLRKYLLTGFVFCGSCGRALTSNVTDGVVYYRHHRYVADKGCSFHAIPGPKLEPAALGYLYKFFLDEPAFDAAIKQSIPTSKDRENLEKEIKREKSRLSKNQQEIKNLVNAIAKGAKVSLLLNAQNDLEKEQQALTSRLDDLKSRLATMSDESVVRQQASAIRLQLFFKHKGKDWRNLPFDDVRTFLRYLFGDNTKKTGLGIFVTKVDDKWILSFKGHVAFDAEVVNGRVIPHSLKKMSQAYNAKINELFAGIASCSAEMDNSLSIRTGMSGMSRSGSGSASCCSVGLCAGTLRA